MRGSGVRIPSAAPTPKISSPGGAVVLTQDEINFLSRHGLSPEDVLDGRHLSQAGARSRAEELGKTLVLGSPCRARGHKLRTRPGHCAQCDPKKIAYQGRFSSPGYV